MKIALLLLATLAVGMVSAALVPEDEGLFDPEAEYLNLIQEQEAATEAWFRRAISSVTRTVRKGIGYVRKACSYIGQSPEEAKQYLLKAFPEMKEEDMTEEYLTYVYGTCKGARMLG